MSVADTDLVVYGAANHAESDSGTQGGAIDTTVRLVPASSSLFNTLEDEVEILSSNAGDTSQTVTVTGRLASGAIVAEAMSLNGTTVVTSSNTFERLLKIVVSGSHTGTITVRKESDNTSIVAIESGVLTIRRPFYNVSADVSGGSSRVFYEKVFVKNNHSTLALLAATISEQSDSEGQITFALDSAVNGTTTSTNRVTAPASGVSSFDSSAKAVPGTDLAAGAKIGVWLALTLPAGDPATKATYTLRTAGSST